MNGILKISEAASIAIHAMVYMTKQQPKKTTAREIAANLGASEFHLAKVMARLSKTGLVNSVRGPGGGFTLAKPPEEIRLIDVYEAIEGRINFTDCLFERPETCGDECVMGGLLREINDLVRNYMNDKTLAGLAGARADKGGQNDKEAANN